MATEYIVGDSIVACLIIKAPAPQATSPSTEPWFRSVCSTTPDSLLAEGE